MRKYRVFYTKDDWTRNGWVEIYDHIDVDADNCYEARIAAGNQLAEISEIQFELRTAKPTHPNFEFLDCVLLDESS